MNSQHDRAAAFRLLHERPGAFLIPNPYDAGTARLLALTGFEALATTSAGCAFALGLSDNHITRDQALAHCAAIAAASDLPVNGDLENGFGDDPGHAAETIRLGAAAGLVGGSIEDASGDPEKPIYESALAAERVRAAAEAAHSLAFPFLLTARAENFLHGRPDLNDTIRRLQAFQDAGADVLYAPGLSRIEDIKAVVKSVDRPVNVLAGAKMNFAELQDVGVKRISVGSALSRAAIGAFLRAANEMRHCGTFTYMADAEPYARINELFKP